MAFLAGALRLDSDRLAEEERARFQKALDHIAPLVQASSLTTLSRPSALLALSGHGRLWQGPQLLTTPHLDAAGIGIQWQRIDGTNSALEALALEFLRPHPAPPDAFDGFSCAFLPRNTGAPVLVTDPLGLFPLCYAVRHGTLFFSSHQTFLRALLETGARPDPQAALQFLMIGHPLGDRTLMAGVRMLPPGTRLLCKDDGIRLSSYGIGDANGHEPATPIPASSAAALLYERLSYKRDNYSRLSNGPVLGFLSGGWDSRLLVALFANAGRIRETLTTQQRVRLEGCYVSEELIAREVAGLLGIKNRFVPPSYRDPSSLVHRSAMLDWSTWFHEWAFEMVGRVPEGRYLLLDGLLGDILIRGLFMDDHLAAAQEKQDRGAVCRILHQRFLQGFNTYTPGVEKWGPVLRPEVLKSFKEGLWEDLKEELARIDHPETASMFLLRNRSRRAIAPLSRLVFGRKGDVHLPFCDPGFVRLALSLPLNGRMDGSIYGRLLELARPGLARIPSTNEKDPVRMAPYLTKDLPEASIRGREERRKARLKALCDTPPRVFAPMLRPEILTAPAGRDMEVVGRHLLLLERIQMLERFFG